MIVVRMLMFNILYLHGVLVINFIDPFIAYIKLRFGCTSQTDYKTKKCLACQKSLNLIMIWSNVGFGWTSSLKGILIIKDK